jgi:putative FmdB family regulatory protein
MPLYDFACEKGHVTEEFFTMKGPRPKTVKCGVCRMEAHRVYSAPVVVDDFPEHFNISVGEVVKNRAHMRRIQKERGLKDYDPVPGSPGYELVEHRLRKGA